MMVDAHSHIFPAVRGVIASGPTYGIGYGCIKAGNKVIHVLPPYCERTAFTPEMLLANLDWTNVDKAVLLQGPYYGECNEYVCEALLRYPDRLIGMAYFDPWLSAGSAGLEHLAQLLDSGPFTGVKIEFSEATGLCGVHPGARLDAPGLDWLWRELERRGLVLVLDLGAVGSQSYQTSAVNRIAQCHPDLKVVIPHLAQPNPQVEADSALWQRWLEQVDLARRPNVWLDMAALPSYLPQEDYPYPSVTRYVRMAVERVGVDKVLWGTDQPGPLPHVTYPQLVKLARLHMTFLSSDEQAKVLGANAATVYNA